MRERLSPDFWALLLNLESRLAEGAREGQRWDTREQQRAADDEHDKEREADVHQRHQLAERQQDGEAASADSGADGGEHADGREPHDVARHHEHRLRDTLEQRHDGTAHLANRRQGRTEEAGEHHDLQDVAARNVDYWRALTGLVILALVLLLPRGLGALAGRGRA